MMKSKVAIACQGGGSQTAFTAGVLKAFYENKIQNHFDIVSLSGTSGGAICAFFIWYALKRGDEVVWKRLLDFWEDNTAQSVQERFFNDLAIKTMELANTGQIPKYNFSPSSVLFQTWFHFISQSLRSRFTDLREMLEAHINFSELSVWGAQPKPPILILGACNILSGKLQKFSSYREPINIDHLLASACIPSLFPAVSIEEMAFWDGLFSDNPPISALIKRYFVGVKNIPEEIWVIKINPTTREKTPTCLDDINDRRIELEGNVSLFQNLGQIKDLNDLLLKNAFRDEFLDEINIKEPIKIPKLFVEHPDKDYHIPMIEMSEDLANNLNYESALDRSPEMINRLIQDGEKQGRKFVESRLKSKK
jgi:NTE family protein